MVRSWCGLLAVFLLLILNANPIYSQDYCDAPFTENDFGDIQKVTLKYARVVEPTGFVDSIDLYLDLYYSAANMQSVQPVMILLHGGSFITELGNKGSMEEVSRIMISKGFVVISIDYTTWSYTLGGLPTKHDIIDVVVKAILDLQNSIEFVAKISGQDGLPKMDVQHMIIGGGSAGAITTNHWLYLDSQDSLPDFLNDAFEYNGGLFDKESDDYEVVYGLNMSGGIFDTAWIDPGEAPLISIHGDKDSTVFYDHGLANGVIELYGSKPIDERLTKQGIDSYFYTFKGGGHYDIYEDIPMYREPLLKVLDTGLMIIQEDLCLTSANRYTPVAAQVKLINTLVQHDLLVKNGEGMAMDYDILDLWGRTLQSGILQPGTQRITFSSPIGGYFVFRAYGRRNGSDYTYQQLYYYGGQ